MGSWKNQYNALQNISDPEERGMKTAELMADIGTTVAAVRSAGKVVTSFSEFGGTVVKESGNANFVNQKKLDKHYEKHVKEQGEFGNITKEEYLKKANDFISSSGSNVSTRVASNGDILKFNNATNEFSIVTKDNVIRTYHKLDPNIHGQGSNLDYWNGPDCNY